ncbi:MAG: hypothetical protein AAF490_28600 [Chloroflexota bacterium]
MYTCAKCKYDIFYGEEVWIRRKSKDVRLPICKNCESELRAKRQGNQTRSEPAGAVESLSDPLAKTALAAGKSWASDIQGSESSPQVQNSSNTIPIDSIFMFILLIGIGAPILGAIVAGVGYFVYLVILFPLVLATAVGWLGGKCVRWGKLRHDLIATLFGLLFGLCTYMSYRYIEYQIVRQSIIPVMIETSNLFESSAYTREEANHILDAQLIEATGRSGFLGFALAEAQEGLTLSRRSQEFNIGSNLTIIYWLFEVGVVSLGGLIGAFGSAKRPFCETHDRWFTDEQLLGAIEAIDAESLIQLVQQGNYESAAKMLDPHNMPTPGLALYLESCPNCPETSPILTGKQVQKDRKGNLDYKEVFTKELPPLMDKNMRAAISVA